ncbi:hypothetical protein SPBRAN_908 [uncultured Candidatus Thioglobus sp.]|nr:hypothetical protein SPBRAN_908 [uncultured Candidatus Thioglobus sp.]
MFALAWEQGSISDKRLRFKIHPVNTSTKRRSDVGDSRFVAKSLGGGLGEVALGDLCINRNNQQNTTFYQIGYFIKTCRSPAGTNFNKIPNLAKSVILLITPIYAKVSKLVRKISSASPN